MRFSALFFALFTLVPLAVAAPTPPQACRVRSLATSFVESDATPAAITPLLSPDPVVPADSPVLSTTTDSPVSPAATDTPSDTTSTSSTSSSSSPPLVPSPPSVPSNVNLLQLAGTHHGQATYYDTGLGACGILNTNDDMIAAISKQVWDVIQGSDSNPNHNPACNVAVTATMDGGSSVTVLITDRCEACAPGDLDFSPAAFMLLMGSASQNSNQGMGIGRASGLTWTLA